MLPQSKAKKKTMPHKWAWQGKVQLKIKMSIVQFSTNHSLRSLAMNIRLDDEIDAAAAKSNILLQFELKCELVLVSRTKPD